MANTRSARKRIKTSEKRRQRNRAVRSQVRSAVKTARAVEPSQGAEGRTVILIEHKMKVVMNISDRITVLHQGQVLAEGSPAEIRANLRVQQTYLGAAK